MDWYQQNHQQALDALQSGETGLSSQEAQNRLAQYGPNNLAEEESISRLQILLHQFQSPLIYILEQQS